MVLPTTADSDSKESLETVFKTHYVWRSRHHGATPREYKTFHIIVDDNELDADSQSNRNSIHLATWSQPSQGHTDTDACSRGKESIGLHACTGHVRNDRHCWSGQTLQLTITSLRLLGLNLSPEVVLGKGLMSYHNRDGSDYTILQLQAWTQKSLLDTRCSYGYITELLIIRCYKYHMNDVIAVNGPDYAYMCSLRRVLTTTSHSGETRTTSRRRAPATATCWKNSMSLQRMQK